ncbi:hypothetical protein [Pseudomonas aeruginosa]|uniref:hypothetical protein n=1 Tax=Pseudomonas aeruginosa TaxID=287 RepID=UPI0034E0CDD0
MADNTDNLFLMNNNGNYFEINTKEVTVAKERFYECRFFDTQKELLEAVSTADGCPVEDLEGTTFYITMRNGKPTMIDDRGFPHEIEGSVETFITCFVL